MVGGAVTFSERAEDLKTRVEKVMASYMDGRVQGETRLAEAVQYAVRTEGKRIRPMLAYATAELLNVPLDLADYPAAAIELTHTYSLVHDDLPAMDDDDLRRGKPTVHRAYDEATAVLVGDALLTLAFDLLASAPVDPPIAIKWIQQLALFSGAAGMIQGQSTDLEGEERSLTLGELEVMHQKKTGGLIEAGMTMVTCLAPDMNAGTKLKEFGRHIGLAFQIRDDILDVEASTEVLGKPQGSDAQRNKSTFVSLLGVDSSRERLQQEFNAALAALNGFGSEAEGLRWLASFIIARQS